MGFNNLYYFVYFTFYISSLVTSTSLEKASEVESKQDSGSIFPRADVSAINMDEVNKVRVKRQSARGEGKFTEAAKMPQVKIMRLFLQLFKNFWSASYIGGAHPFHPNIPKTAVALYKQKIVEFFVPDVGADPEKLMA